MALKTEASRLCICQNTCMCSSHVQLYVDLMEFYKTTEFLRGVKLKKNRLLFHPKRRKLHVDYFIKN